MASGGSARARAEADATSPHAGGGRKDKSGARGRTRQRQRQRERRGSAHGAHVSHVRGAVVTDPTGESFASLLEVARFAQHQAHRCELLLGALGHDAGTGGGTGRSGSPRQSRWMTPEAARLQLEQSGLGGGSRYFEDVHPSNMIV